MQYSHILALIDADLDRLRKVRQLLASLLDAPDLAPETPRRPRRSRSHDQSPDDTQIDLFSASPLPGPADTPTRPVHRRTRSKSKAPADRNAALEEQPSLLDQYAPEFAAPPIVSAPEETTSDEHASRHEPDVSAYLPLARKQRPRRNSSPIRKTPPTPAPVPTALGGLVPAGPVFIPAGQIRQPQAPKPQEHPAASLPTPSLTEELLKQRWLHNSVS